MADRSDYCWSIDGEEWHVDCAGSCLTPRFDGPYASREEALAAAQASYPDAETVQTAECMWAGNAQFFDAADILERVADHASSEVEDSDSYPDVTKEAEAELQALLDAWTAKHLPSGPGWYECDDIREHHVEPTAPVASPQVGES